MAAKGKEAPAEKIAAPKKGKTMIILVAASLISLAGLGGGAMMYLKKPAHEAPADEESGDGGEEGSHAKASPEMTFVAMEQPFVVNLAGGQERFAQIAVTIAVSDPKVSEPIKARSPLLRDRILRIVGAKKAEELLTGDGKEKLAKEILATVKEGMPASQRKLIKEVLFTSFIVQ